MKNSSLRFKKEKFVRLKKKTPATILGETCTSQCSVNFARAVFAKLELQKNVPALQPLTKKRARLSLSPSLALFPFFSLGVFGPTRVMRA